MAERRPRVVIVPPGGAGLQAALSQLVTPESVVTALEDSALHAAKTLLGGAEANELLPFGSCVGRFAAMCGDTGLPRLTNPQSHHIVQRAAAGFSFASVLHRVASSSGLARNLSKTLTELRYHRIVPDDLRLAAQECGDPVTAERLKQLADLYASFVAETHSANREFASERAEFCLAQHELRTFPYKHLVVVVSGDRSPVYDLWIQWVAKQGVRVDCVMAAWPASDAFSYESDWAAQLGDVDDWTEGYSGAETWTAQLFQDRSPDTMCPVKVRHESMGDALSECEWTIRSIQELLQSGADPASIGVFVRGGQETVPIFLGAAERLGLAVAGTRTSPLRANGFVSVTLELLQALSGADIRHMRRPLANSYFQIPHDLRESLDKALVALHASSTDPWEGFEAAVLDNSDTAWLAQLAEWRRSALASPRPMRMWAEMLHTLWARTPVLDHSIAGPREAVDRDQKAWTLMQRTIRDATLSYRTDDATDFAGFVALAEELWKDENIVWESERAAIRLCTTANELTGFDHLFCLNMLEGTIPRRRRQDPVLDDIDRGLLNQALPKMDPLPDSGMVAHRERGLFVTICASARQTLVFSHADAGDDRDNIATFYLEEVRTLVPTFETVSHPRSQLTPLPEACRNSPDRSLCDALAGPRTDFVLPELASDQARAAVRPNFDKLLPVYELAQAAACGFRAAVGNRTAYDPGDRSLPIALMRSLPKEANLVKQPSKSEAKAVLKSLAQSKLEDHLHRLDDWEQVLFQDALDRIIQGWVDREFAAREFLRLDEYRLTEDFVGRDVLKGDPTIHLSVAFDAVYESGPNRIGFLYRGYIPRYLSNAKEDIESSLLAALMLYSLGPKPHTNEALMVDSLEGDRAILTKERKVPWLTRSLYRTGIYHASVISSNEEFKSSNIDGHFKEAVERARKTLKLATARPTPGNQCDHCQLGDLCRSHREYGEQQSLFDEVPI